VTRVRDHWWWRPGWQEGRRYCTFHITFGQQPGVQRLAGQARERLKGFPALDLVPDRWLHLTMQGIGFSDELSAPDLAKIVQAAVVPLLSVPAAEITVGAPRAVSEGVASWVSPAGSLDLVRDTLRAAIGSARGTANVPEAAEWSPHVSFAYASADADGEPYDAALAGLAAVPATINTVEMIRLGRDQHVYQWETIISLDFGVLG
jgi:2'-5' RNA ligase